MAKNLIILLLLSSCAPNHIIQCKNEKHGYSVDDGAVYLGSCLVVRGGRATMQFKSYFN